MTPTYLPPLSKNKKSQLRKLAQKRQRYKSGFYCVEGQRAVQNYLEHQAEHISYIVLSEEWPFSNSLFNAFEDRIYYLEETEFMELTDTDSPQGIMAVCRMDEFQKPSELASGSGTILALDRISDPGNMGTMIRTAVWFGVEGIVLSPECVDIYNPKVIRSSAGSLAQLQYAQSELYAFIEEAKSNNRPVLALELNEEAQPLKNLDSGDRNDPVIIVGNEAHGLDQSLLSLPVKPVYIPSPSPKADKVESLNAAQALTIALYEVNR